MIALQLVEHGSPGKFRVTEVPDPIAKEDEALIKVHACGLNHLDLWLEEAGLPVPIDLPRIPGCEISGEVISVPDNARNIRVGDRVAVQSNIFCGKCEFCLRGQESICVQGTLLGIQIDGGFAEKIAVPVRTLVPLPAKVTFEQSAALTLAGSTAMHMLTSRTQVLAGEWVLVVGGASGVGSAGIQIARALGAKVVTTASTPEKGIFATGLGAHYVVDSTDPKWASEVRKITGKRGVDTILEHVGGDVLLKCFECLARGGTIVTCGATAGREVNLNLWPLFVKEQRLIGSYGRNRSDMEKTLAWAGEGKIKAVIDNVYPLAESPRAFLQLRERKVLGKLVVTP